VTQQYAVVDPATGEMVKHYAPADNEAVRAAIERADATHRAWSRSSTVADRSALLARLAELYEQHRGELASIIVREIGKPVEQAAGEVDFAAAIYRYYADEARSIMADEPIALRDGDGRALLRRASLGVLLGIMPWNYPYYQVARFAAPNLLVGNTILLKHAPQCPESAARMEELFAEAGFLDGAYNNVYATHDQVETIIADARVRGVSLTGSERAGAAVAEIAGRHLKKVVLELGGSDAFIVLGTSDLDATVRQAVAARLENTGQSCTAAKRFIVVDELYDAFVEKLAAAFAAIAPGDPSSASTIVGPLSSEAAADRLEDQVRRAVAQGATLVAGGKRSGNFLSPALLTDVAPANDAYYEELFGPVAQVHRVADEQAAIDLANDSPYGLGGYVFTDDPAQAERVADALDTGMVYVNVVNADGPELPFGGVKRSGFGRELGREGANEFVNKKLIRFGR
jgi:succinate-semialdehyde dehydrogenase / glutarate-semialdehyde dehydrogenase